MSRPRREPEQPAEPEVVKTESELDFWRRHAEEEHALRVELLERLANPKLPDTRTLDERMAAVQAELEDVPRRGHAEVTTRSGANYSYDYILEADLMTGVRPLLAKHGVAVYYSDELLSLVDGLATVRVEVRYRANGEEIVTQATAIATDTGDKSANKAKTSGVRYLLWKTFLQPSDEDPEQENVTRDDAAKASGDRSRRHQLAKGTATARTAGDDDGSKGRLIQRVSELAIELDEVQSRPPGAALTKLLEALEPKTLGDLEANEVLEIGKALAEHVAAERALAEQEGIAYDPTDFEVPELGT
jgi:hypothetical protein